MATIQIRDVPEDVHRRYKTRAAAAGMSLQEYLRAELIEAARLQSPGEVAAEVADDAADDGSGLSRTSATAYLRRERDQRGSS